MRKLLFVLSATPVKVCCFVFYLNVPQLGIDFTLIIDCIFFYM